jgi:hypothetical protein
MGRAIALLALLLLSAGTPQAAQADTCEHCHYPFRAWVGNKAVAVYRFDDDASSWTTVEGQEPFYGCLFRGTFVFRRIDTIQGRAPAVIRQTFAAMDEEECGSWNVRGMWARPPTSPAGRWLHVVSDYGGYWFHVNPQGVIDSDDTDGGDAPKTLAGAYAALRVPETDTAKVPLHAPAPPVLPLGVAAVAGFVLGLRYVVVRGSPRRGSGPRE